MALKHASETTSLKFDGMPDIPVQIFEKFLQALEAEHISAELVSRLRKTLLEEHTFTEAAIKAAVISEESLQ